MTSIRPVSFDGSFELEAAERETLFSLLKSEVFYNQVSEQVHAPVTFTELLFQPVPYSAETPHGMAREFEAYYKSEDHVVINVPANFLFKAKIARPNRLCAIYRKHPATAPD